MCQAPGLWLLLGSSILRYVFARVPLYIPSSSLGELLSDRGRGGRGVGWGLARSTAVQSAAARDDEVARTAAVEASRPLRIRRTRTTDGRVTALQLCGPVPHRASSAGKSILINRLRFKLEEVGRHASP